MTEVGRDIDGSGEPAEDVEAATLAWVHWWNTARLLFHLQRPTGGVRGR